MNLALNAILVLLALFTYFVEDIYLSTFPPKIGDRSYITIRAKIPFDFDQEKSYGTKRDVALAKYVPLYNYNPENFTISKTKIQNIIKRTTSIIGEKNGAAKGDELRKYLKRDLGVDISSETAVQILQYNNIVDLLKAILVIEETILQEKIVSDPVPLKDKKSVEIAFPKPLGTVTYPRSEVLTLDEARTSLSGKISQVFWQVDKNILDPVIKICLSTISPNLKYDQKENDRRIKEIIQLFPSKIISYKAGDVLVPFRKALSDEDLLLLSSYYENETTYQRTKAPLLLAIIVILMMLYNLILTYVIKTPYVKKIQPAIMLYVLIGSIIILKSYALMTAFLICSLPIAIIPLVALQLRVERIPITTMTITGAIIISLLLGLDYKLVVFNCTAGIVAILAARRIKRRSDIIMSGLIVAFVNLVIIMMLFLDWSVVRDVIQTFTETKILSLSKIFNLQLLKQMGWAFFGGALAAPLSFIFLPCLSLLCHRASVFQLNNYADLEHPLMKDLLTMAPGTYQHAMMVAHLGQAAGEAVGADSLLIRIGAYYHDIGKIGNPQMFIENQFGGENPHDNLTALESTKIIMEHVLGGRRIGEKAHLPSVILDFIPQHQGTLLVEYFYEKARNAAEASEVKEEDFRYPGPKPQQVETAIVMIADAVEAASRTLSEPSPEKIEHLVRRIIEKRLEDDQFDECNLSTMDLAKIRAAMIQTLIASLHNRIEYPWQQEAK